MSIFSLKMPLNDEGDMLTVPCGQESNDDADYIELIHGIDQVSVNVLHTFNQVLNVFYHCFTRYNSEPTRQEVKIKNWSPHPFPLKEVHPLQAPSPHPSPIDITILMSNDVHLVSSFCGT